MINFYSHNSKPEIQQVISLSQSNLVHNLKYIFEKNIRELSSRKKLCSFPYYNFTDSPKGFYFYWLDIIGQHKIFSKGDIINASQADKIEDNTIKKNNIWISLQQEILSKNKFNIPDKVKLDAINNKCKIIIDASIDKFDTHNVVDDFNFNFELFFKFVDLPKSCFVFLVGEADVDINKLVPSLYYNFWEKFSAIQFHNMNEIKNSILNLKERKWSGLCLNRITNSHRIEICKFISENLLDKIDYSFGYFPYIHARSNLDQTEQVLDMVKWNEIIYNNPAEDYLNWLRSHGEKISDTDASADMSINMNTIGNPNSYLESYFNIVTETSQSGSVYLSEKIFKPIFWYQPFIAISAPGTIQFLKKLGYDVFEDIIDHSYDFIENENERINIIKQEVVRLSKIKKNEWSKILYNIFSRLEHNHNHLKKSLFRHINFYK